MTEGLKGLPRAEIDGSTGRTPPLSCEVITGDPNSPSLALAYYFLALHSDVVFINQLTQCGAWRSIVARVLFGCILPFVCEWIK